MLPNDVNKDEISDISAGQTHNCAINKSGKLSCWPVVRNWHDINYVNLKMIGCKDIIMYFFTYKFGAFGQLNII